MPQYRTGTGPCNVANIVRFVKKAVRVERPNGTRIEVPRAPRGVGCREGGVPSPQKIFNFFHFKIVHSGAFSYTHSKVLFAIKCREGYVIMVFLAIDSDTDIKTLSFHQSRKLIAVQSVISQLQ